MTTFSAAFAAARKEKGPGKTFTWKGKLYTTDRADDKPAKKTKSTDMASSPRPKASPRTYDPDKPPSVMSEAPAFPAAPQTGNRRHVGIKTDKLTSMVRKALSRADNADTAAANKTRDDMTKAEWDKLQDRRKKSRGERMYGSVSQPNQARSN